MIAPNAAIRRVLHVKPNDFSGEHMSQELPKQAPHGTSILLVGMTPDVLVRVTAFVAPHGIETRATTLVKLHADTAKFRPIVILVDTYLYEFDADAFDKLVSKAGVKLGVVSSAKEAEKILTQMLPAPVSTTDATADDDQKSASGQQAFETARYDKKTIDEALKRMGSKGPEFTTAKYDKKTLHDALERMNTNPSDLETGKYDAAALRAAIKRSDES